MMNLFKRMFPKWNYDPYISDYVGPTSKRESEFELPVVDKIQLTKKKKPELEKMDV
jgi:hypothetical protein